MTSIKVEDPLADLSYDAQFADFLRQDQFDYQDPFSHFSEFCDVPTLIATASEPSIALEKNTEADQDLTASIPDLPRLLVGEKEQTTLNAHQDIGHCRSRKFYCHFEGCGKSFTTSGHAARHNRIHTGERRYVCPLPDCGARFSRQDNCNQHIKTHDHARQRLSRRSSTRTTSNCPSDHDETTLKHRASHGGPVTNSDGLRRALSCSSASVSIHTQELRGFSVAPKDGNLQLIDQYKPCKTTSNLDPVNTLRTATGRPIASPGLHTPDLLQIQPLSLDYSNYAEDDDDSWHFLSDSQLEQDWSFFTEQAPSETPPERLDPFSFSAQIW